MRRPRGPLRSAHSLLEAPERARSPTPRRHLLAFVMDGSPSGITLTSRLGIPLSLHLLDSSQRLGAEARDFMAKCVGGRRATPK